MGKLRINSRKAREMVNAVEHLLHGVDAIETWTWEQRKHYRLTIFLRDGQKFFSTVAITASDPRTRMNTIAQIKRQLREKGVEI